MNADKKNICTCTSCHSRYQVPESFEGKTVVCKKCQTKFTVVFQTPGSEQAPRENADKAPSPEQETSDPSLRLGRLAVALKLVSTEQLQKAILIQKREMEAGRKLMLGQILVANRMLSQQQLSDLLTLQNMKRARELDVQFGTMALQQGLTTQDQINKALEEQKRLFTESKSIALIGDILVSVGAITAEQRTAILSAQGRVERTALEDVEKTAAPEEPEKEAPEEPEEEAPEEEGFEVVVSEDRMAAYIQLKKGVAGHGTVAKVRNLLAEKNVIYGILPDDEIEAYLKSRPDEDRTFMVAEGTPPQAGRDASIRYLFDTDPLKIGRIKESGAIDFKDRGDIPQVGQGDIIAEKTPLDPGVPGMDVLGKEIRPPKYRDTHLRCGPGAAKSEDGLSVFAKVGGQPVLSHTGKLQVLPCYFIQGDVSLATGHVDFQGRIEVSGAVEDGFRVKGETLDAREILKAVVEMSGDVVVSGGIIGARIRTGGNLKAKYISGARIEAAGDVVVQKEILDSFVESSGSVIVRPGRILSSEICAKNGIDVVEVGSDRSRSCKIVVGLDERSRRAIDEYRRRIADKEKEQENLKSLIEEFQQESDGLMSEIGELSQVQDRAMVQHRTIKKKLEDVRQRAAGGDELDKIEKALSDLESSMNEGQVQLEEMLERQDQVTEKVAEHQEKVGQYDVEIQELREDIEAITRRLAEEKATCFVKVTGSISDGTVVRGPHSSITVRGNQQRVAIRETQDAMPDGAIRWCMAISPL